MPTRNIEDYGIISLMYHRFDENKYPSTNIRMDDFLEHIKIIEEKLPGPILTIIENLLSIFTLYLFNRFNMFETN